MKRFIYTLLTIIISTNLFAQHNTRVIELSGKIEDRYPIEMKISINENEIVGYYFYEKHRIKIPIEGLINDNNIKLTESPSIENVFNIGFFGNISKDTFKGQWVNQNENKEMSFQMEILKDTSVTVNSLNGKYFGEYNSENIYDELKITNIDSNYFLFDITVSNANGCVGNLINIVEIDINKIGIYTGELCDELKFSFTNSDLINVSELNCDWHGFRCPFTGRYIKNSP